MSEETQTDHPGILYELRKIRRMQEEVRSRLDRIETALQTLPELEIRMGYLPQSIAEQLQGIIPGEGTSSPSDQPVSEVGHTPYQPERKASWSWKEHILFTLFQEDRPLLSAELIDILHGLEVRGKKDRRLVVKDVSKNLTVLVKVGRLVKFKPEGAGKFFYCLPGWMDGEGELRAEYWGRGAFL